MVKILRFKRVILRVRKLIISWKRMRLVIHGHKDTRNIKEGPS